MTLHPAFPVVEGPQRLTAGWTLELPGRFNRRVEDEELVIWRPGLTFLVAVWGALPGRSPADMLAWTLAQAAPERTDERIEPRDGLLCLTYRLREHDPGRTPAEYTSISGYVFAAPGHVQITAYCDGAADVAAGDRVIRSVRIAAAD